MAMRRRFSMTLWLLASCGATLSAEQADHLRQQLRAAMQEPVATRDERDQHSRLLADVVGKDALHGLDQEQVRAAFGRGDACRIELCAQHGFTPDDWLYEIGHTDDPKIKQLPLLIVGFDPQRRAARVWTLTTH
jgi:hypothetical protein